MSSSELAFFGILLLIAVVSSAPPPHVPSAVINHQPENNGTITSDVFNHSNSTLPASTGNNTAVSTEKKPEKKARLLELLGLGLGGYGYGGLGYGGYGYGGYGGVPFPCSTTRLAALGFPYYNPVCYGYSVPSFPYYGGPLG